LHLVGILFPHDIVLIFYVTLSYWQELKAMPLQSVFISSL